MLKVPSSHTALSLIQAWALLVAFLRWLQKSGKTKGLKILQQSKGRAFLNGKRDVCPCVVLAGLREKPWFAEGFSRRPNMGREESQKRWAARGKSSMRCTFFDMLPHKRKPQVLLELKPQQLRAPQAPRLSEQKEAVGGWLQFVGPCSLNRFQ